MPIKDNLSIISKETDHILNVLERKLNFGSSVSSDATESHEEVLRIKEGLEKASKLIVEKEQEAISNSYLELIKNNKIDLDDLQNLIKQKKNTSEK